jgi:hypothetical protein
MVVVVFSSTKHELERQYFSVIQLVRNKLNN